MPFVFLTPPPYRWWLPNWPRIIIEQISDQKGQVTFVPCTAAGLEDYQPDNRRIWVTKLVASNARNKYPADLRHSICSTLPDMSLAYYKSEHVQHTVWIDSIWRFETPMKLGILKIRKEMGKLKWNAKQKGSIRDHYLASCSIAQRVKAELHLSYS